MNLEKNKTCFYCEHFYHANPDDDKCRLSGKIVYVDTPKCSDFELPGAYHLREQEID